MNEPKSALEQLLAGAPIGANERVELPSKCALYKYKGAVELRPINFEDEKLIVQSVESGQDPSNLIISRCMLSGPQVESLLIIDKLFLIIRIRALSYGKTLPVETKCVQCRKENTIVFKLNELDVNYMEEDYKEPKEIMLPVLGKPACVRMPRVVDDQYMSSSKASMDNMWRFVVSLNGVEDIKFIQEAINHPNFPLRDIHAIINAVGGGGYGVQTAAKFNCEFCNTLNTIALPLDANFFSMS